MDMKAIRWQILHGSLPRRFVLRAFFFALTMTMYPFMKIARDDWRTEPFSASGGGCNSVSIKHLYRELPIISLVFRLLTIRSIACNKHENVTMDVFQELMNKNLLDSNDKALIVGEGSTLAAKILTQMGLRNSLSVERHPRFSLLRGSFVYDLDLDDESFNFVFSEALDLVSVPALFVLEVERVLRPSGIGAMLVGAQGLYSGSLIRSAAPVSSFLKSSNIVLLYPIGSFSLVVFQKQGYCAACLNRYHLPSDCPSVISNKPFMEKLEPIIVGEKPDLNPEVSYLAKWKNMSSKNRVVYINVGAGEYLNSNITGWVKPDYFLPSTVYLIDQDSRVLSAYVTKAGITFIYNPNRGPVGSDTDDEGFDFTAWLKSTVEERDFVIVAVNSGMMEMKLLIELLENGGICHVDELFARCSGGGGKDVEEQCLKLLRDLRKNGVYAHQWLVD